VPRFLFGAPTNQVVFPMAGPRALSQLNPDRDKIFGFSASKNFQGASGATTSAAHGFKFGALANLQAPPASFTAPYSSDAAYQAYLQRVFDVTSNQGLLKRAPMKSCSPKPSDDAAYQQYVQRILEATSNQGLIKHSIHVTTSVSKTSSDMKLMLFERKKQLSDPQSNRLWANSVVCSKNSAVLVLLVT